LCSSSIPSDDNFLFFFFFLILLQCNFNQVQNFSRSKLQTTIAISRLVGGNLGSKNDHTFLKEGLKAISAYAITNFKERMKSGSIFGQDVQKLVTRLFDVISYSERMQELRFDPEIRANLLWQISNGKNTIYPHLSRSCF